MILKRNSLALPGMLSIEMHFPLHLMRTVGGLMTRPNDSAGYRTAAATGPLSVCTVSFCEIDKTNYDDATVKNCTVLKFCFEL
ncbi:hypothetical protein EVAR_15968_1 [Eumeta japonica]|uniref:Uncharacterized protein n=1 Tax=Eumeta variegata TaxID=151549 RepID=A0A4C1UL96_EUMVA|nr:hypothetical protein EVAR_15968_1 [Eumeta japonica]